MNDDELVQRAAEERAAIVAKYRRGRHEGAIIDPWEDPSFEIYHILDRYGFIHDKNIKHYSEEHTTEAPNPSEVKVEMERVKKWLKMLRQWDAVVNTDRHRRRVFKGIPNSLRGQVWSKMLNLPTIREQQAGKYQEMRSLAWKWSPDIRQIDLDVNRTYRDHIMFRERYNLKQQELFNVLGAYSMYNLEIGYCQGMSQIAALLLMYLDEEDAFWALSVLVSDRMYSMHGFFIPGFPKLLRYQEHHDKIMKRFLPKLKKHLDKNGVDTGIYTLKWFFQCFLDRIPFKLTLRVWDVYLLIGERVLPGMAYNLLKLHRRKLLSLGMDDILQFLQVRLERRFDVDDDVAMESLQRCLEELRKSKLDYPGHCPPNELPKKPFGMFQEPTIQQKVGLRAPEFSEVERTARDSVVLRRDEAITSAIDDEETIDDDDMEDEEFTSPGRNPAPNGHAGHFDGKLWLDGPSVDDASSLVGDGSRRSLAETSITSTADLSVFSSVTGGARSAGGGDTDPEEGPTTPYGSALRKNGEDEKGYQPLEMDLDDNNISLFNDININRRNGDLNDSGGEDGPITPRALSPDILRIFVPYDSPSSPPSTIQSPSMTVISSTSLNGDITAGNKIRIIVMDQTPQEESTPLAELASSPIFSSTLTNNNQEIDLK